MKLNQWMSHYKCGCRIGPRLVENIPGTCPEHEGEKVSQYMIPCLTVPVIEITLAENTPVADIDYLVGMIALLIRGLGISSDCIETRREEIKNEG